MKQCRGFKDGLNGYGVMFENLIHDHCLINIQEQQTVAIHDNQVRNIQESLMKNSLCYIHSGKYLRNDPIYCVYTSQCSVLARKYHGDSSKWFKMCAEEFLKQMRHYETPAPCGKDSARHCGAAVVHGTPNSRFNIGTCFNGECVCGTAAAPRHLENNHTRILHLFSTVPKTATLYNQNTKKYCLFIDSTIIIIPSS